MAPKNKFKHDVPDDKTMYPPKPAVSLPKPAHEKFPTPNIPTVPTPFGGTSKESEPDLEVGS